MPSKLSILISSKNRLNLFKRTLWSIERYPPSIPYEVIIADEKSTDNILRELSTSLFPWKFITVDRTIFEKETGIVPYFNCPALTNNVAFRHAEGDLICQMGNEIIVVENSFDALIEQIPKTKYTWTASHTIDLPQEILDEIGTYGEFLNWDHIVKCRHRVMSLKENNVPNYLSIFTKDCWTDTNGYDERYLAGIGAEDSDFMRRCFSLPNFQYKWAEGSISLHQYHGGVSHLYRPVNFSEEFLDKGVKINRELYNRWDGTIHNRQPWTPGTIGVIDVQTSKHYN